MAVSSRSKRSPAAHRPFRHAPLAGAPRSTRGGTLLGIFIGLVIGLGTAAAVAYYLMKNNPAFQVAAGSREARDGGKDAARVKAEADKPKLDFYKILPGGDEAKKDKEKEQAKAPERPDRQVVDQARERTNPKAPEKPADTPVAADRGDTKVASIEDKGTPAAKPGDRFWLQAGSFSTESDAENLRARLALAGWEATVQQALLPDKAVRFRVRMGPYDNTDELNRMKTEVARRGFDVAIIKY